MTMGRAQYISIMKMLVEGSEFVTFEHSSEFVVRIQRDKSAAEARLRKMFGSARIPPVFCIRLRGIWRFGSLEAWQRTVETFPFKGVPPLPIEAPLQASLITVKLGNRVNRVEIDEESNLTLTLSDGSSILVEGVGGGWDESWFLDLPVEDPDLGRWQIVCDSDGAIGGELPEPARSSP